MEAVGIIALIVLALFSMTGLILTPLGMPGNFIIIGGALFHNLILWSMGISGMRLGVALALAVVGEILEFILGVRMARRRGASNRAVIGAIVGGILGAIVGTPVPIIGTIIGLFIGVFLGAFVVEFAAKKDIQMAYSAAMGAFYGRVGAIMVKTLIGVVIVVILFMGAFAY